MNIEPLAPPPCRNETTAPLTMTYIREHYSDRVLLATIVHLTGSLLAERSVSSGHKVHLH